MKTFNFLAISDIHLGHAKTETAHIIKNLKQVIDSKLLVELDMIFIAGDLFDHSLDFSSEEVFEIHKWIAHLLCQCAFHKVDLRILEGTPLHDRKQSRNIEAIRSSLKLDIDFLYVDKVMVERNEKHSLNVLYVPDEWHTDPDQTWLDVTEAISLSGLDTVDLSIMHGMFEHQVPPNSHCKPHINNRYEKITDRYVVIGHIHQPTFYGKIIAPGSFDRLKHGEEETKGCWKVSLSQSGRSDKITFLSNDNAKTYKTIDCSGLSFQSAIEKISIIKAPDKSSIRLRMTSEDNVMAVLEWCKKEFFNYTWTLDIVNVSFKEKADRTSVYKPMEIININSNSLNDLVAKKLKENQENETVTVNALNILKGIN